MRTEWMKNLTKTSSSRTEYHQDQMLSLFSLPLLQRWFMGISMYIHWSIFLQDFFHSIVLPPIPSLIAFHYTHACQYETLRKVDEQVWSGLQHSTCTSHKHGCWGIFRSPLSLTGPGHELGWLEAWNAGACLVYFEALGKVRVFLGTA